MWWQQGFASNKKRKSNNNNNNNFIKNLKLKSINHGKIFKAFPESNQTQLTWKLHIFYQTTNLNFLKKKKIIIMFTNTNTQVKAVKVKWLVALPTCIFPNQKWKQYPARSWNENCKADFPDIGTAKQRSKV